MNLEWVFGLRAAAWPAILVDENGAILESSEVGRNELPGLLAAVPDLDGIGWLQGSPLASAGFLNALRQGDFSPKRVRLVTRSHGETDFTAHSCPCSADGLPLFMVQFIKFDQSIVPDEANRLQKQKLECAMQLARTVSLDFNNALTSILGHASLLLEQSGPDDPARYSLIEIERSAAKAAEIAHDLASFSRQEKEAPGRVQGNLNELVRRLVESMKSPSRPEVLWSLSLEPQLYSVRNDEAKMQQALSKIIDNSLQAISGQGSITVRTQNVDLEAELREGTAKLPPGSYVSLEFIDTGGGIPSEILPRIFEPFFTTKSNPPHRGLGLAWVYGIVANHGGSVSVQSEPGAGTCVRIFLPAQKKFIREGTMRADELTGDQTILLIDDEDLVLNMGQMVLSSYGYRVLTANSGEKALETFGKGSDEIELVITDMVMPQMAGREIIERLRLLSPEVRILCSSGYMRSNGEDDDCFLKKPFTSQQLLRKVKQMLS